MPLLKRYDATASPRLCHYADSNLNSPKCYAELIVQKPNGPVYVCRRHAAKEFSDDTALLANAIREIFLK